MLDQLISLLSMFKYNKIDPFLSYEQGKKNIEQMVKMGTLSEKEAYLIIKEARENYKKQVYNKSLQKVNRIVNG